MNTFSGNYPIEHRAGEIERLCVQSKAMEPDAVTMLERFGSMAGWVCLDIGCGPGGITDLLSARVGVAGLVVGLDMNAQFLEHARRNAPKNIEFRLGDAYRSDLPAGNFDLVHMRFVASTAGQPERLLKEATRLVRPGGLIALQEPDASTLKCFPPHPAWDRLHFAYMAAFKAAGADIELARKLYFLVHQAGLREVQYRTALLGVRPIDPMIDYLPSMIESLRGTILKLGLFSEGDLASTLAECRQHLAKPGTAFTMWTLGQVWGRTA
jgi:ubiquinone/menaquinone biosynthesis C-methylase UbiE